jgi:hypothetical protein
LERSNEIMKAMNDGPVLFVLIVAVLSVLTIAVPAQTQIATECQVTIAELRNATANATFLGPNAAKDQSGLLGKLDSATTKLEQGKAADALQALTQFRDKVATLREQGKIDAIDAETLTAGANEAIACLQRPAT